MPPLLEVKGLHTEFRTGAGLVRAVDGISYSVEPGETVAIVGESGSGKSVGALSILRLIPNPPGLITAGEILFDGRDLRRLSEPEMREIRGRDIGMVFQEPMTSLNPVLTIGRQITESLEQHQGLDRAAADRRAIELLEMVGIADPRRRLKQYPHQLSGGMRQRVMIAVALACNPKLIIADEPTTALDVTIQAQILDLLQDLQKRLGMAILIITHDLGVIAEVADEAQRLAPRDLQADIGDRMHDLVADNIFDDEVFHLQQWRCQGLLHHAPASAWVSIGWKQANWCALVSAASSAGFSVWQRATA